MAALIPFARKGVPAPYLITPISKAEATSGKATLIASGDIAPIIDGLKAMCPERTDLVTKFENLRSD